MQVTIPDGKFHCPGYLLRTVEVGTKGPQPQRRYDLPIR